MTELTDRMKDIRFWLDDGEWVPQEKIYEHLLHAAGVDVTLKAMERRGIIESTLRLVWLEDLKMEGRERLWRKVPTF